MSTSSPLTIREDLRLYRRLLTHVLPYKWVFLFALFGMVVMSAGDAALAAMLKPIVDKGFVTRDETFIAWVPLFLLGLALIRAIGTFIDSYCMTWVARHVVQDLRQLVFTRLIYAPADYYDQHSSGSLVSRLTFDVEQVANASSSAIRVLFRDAVKALFLLAWMFYMDWQLSLIFFLLLPAVAWIFKVSSRRFRAISLRIQTSVGMITHLAQEAFLGQRVVKIFNAYDYQQRIFHRASNHNRQQIMKLTAVQSASVPLMVFLSGVGVAAVVWLALIQEITPGEFASYVTSMIMITKPLRGLTSINLTIQNGLAGAQSVFHTIDLETERDHGTVELDNVVGDVSFNNVSFEYNHGDKPALNGVSFDIKAGTKVALVGRSGSGKSTITSLLLRFYSPSGGDIRIDGHALDSVTLKSLRDHIAIVTQEIVLFNDTIRNNIAYGAHGEIDEQKLLEAATAANVMEFVEPMKDGLASVIGEQGLRLSGGQRQRIAIARALYKDAPLLVMDEATSSLDSHSERHIQSAVNQLVKNRTSLIVAHRLSTIENADLILVLENGRVVQQGKHAELLQQSGVYADLHAAQYHKYDAHDDAQSD